MPPNDEIFPLVKLVSHFGQQPNPHLYNLIGALHGKYALPTQPIPPPTQKQNNPIIQQAIKQALSIARKITVQKKAAKQSSDKDLYFKRDKEQPPRPELVDTSAPFFLFESGNDEYNDHPIGFIIGDISYIYQPNANATENTYTFIEMLTPTTSRSITYNPGSRELEKQLPYESYSNEYNRFVRSKQTYETHLAKLESAITEFIGMLKK